MSIQTQFPQEWLREVISYFGKLGFFNHAEGSDSELQFISDIASTSGIFPEGPFDPKKQTGGFLPEQELLAFDKLRIWCKDSEADFKAGDYWYVRTLLDWSRISRGCFQPQNLSEVWLPPRTPGSVSPALPDEPIEVSFVLGDKQWSFELLERGGWLDYRLIKRANEAIGQTGFQFASVEPDGDQRVYICCLTRVEIQKLKTERGWKFHEEFFCAQRRVQPRWAKSDRKQTRRPPGVGCHDGLDGIKELFM